MTGQALRQSQINPDGLMFWRKPRRAFPAFRRFVQEAKLLKQNAVIVSNIGSLRSSLGGFLKKGKGDGFVVSPRGFQPLSEKDFRIFLKKRKAGLLGAQGQPPRSGGRVPLQQAFGDFSESFFYIVADRRSAQDDHQRNKGRDHAVFDGGRALIVLKETIERQSDLPISCVAVLLAGFQKPDGWIFLHRAVQVPSIARQKD